MPSHPNTTRPQTSFLPALRKNAGPIKGGGNDQMIPAPAPRTTACEMLQRTLNPAPTTTNAPPLPPTIHKIHTLKNRFLRRHRSFHNLPHQEINIESPTPCRYIQWLVFLVGWALPTVPARGTS